MHKLPDIMILMASAALAVGGECFLEVFCGSAVCTLGCMMARVPCIRPWDAKFGSQYNVKVHGHRICELIRMGIIICLHLGVPCISFTQARTVKVRSFESPEGVQMVPGVHTELDRKLLEDGNFLTHWATYCATICMAVGAYFTIENPFPSFFWLHIEVQRLWSMCGVAIVVTSMAPFGSIFKKPTGILHNLPNGELLGDLPSHQT